MASVHVGPDDKQIVMRGSETILAASLREGIPHAYACGGRARCSICRISVEEGLEFCSPRSKGERMVAERLNFSPELVSLARPKSPEMSTCGDSSSTTTT